MNKAQKLVRMVELMARPGGVTAYELMAQFDLDQRSLRRYLSDLRDMEFPLIDGGRAQDRTLTVDPQWRRTGVHLTLSEVLSLHFGRTLFNFLDGTRFTRDLDGALERLQPAISRAHSDLARELDTKFLAVPEPAKRFQKWQSDLVDNLVSALVYNNPVDARYRKPSGVTRTYRLHPYTLATYRQGLYVFAHDRMQDAVKTFAVERFTQVVRRRTEHFEVPESWEPSTHLEHAFGIISGTPRPVAVAFSERVSAYIRERDWHPTQGFRTLRDGRLELSMQVALTIELRTWVLGFGADAEVLSPPELVRQVQYALQRAAARYDNPTRRW